MLRRIWRCSRNVVRSYERLEIKAKADPETYERPANILAYHVPKCRAEMSRIEKLLPDVLSKPISPGKACASSGKFKTKTPTS